MSFDERGTQQDQGGVVQSLWKSASKRRFDHECRETGTPRRRHPDRTGLRGGVVVGGGRTALVRHDKKGTVRPISTWNIVEELDGKD
jgi:hypothetical protein